MLVSGMLASMLSSFSTIVFLVIVFLPIIYKKPFFHKK
jgi:hypothetical protein